MRFKLYYYRAGGLEDPSSVQINDGVLALKGCKFNEIAWTFRPFLPEASSALSLPNRMATFRDLETLWRDFLQQILGSSSPYNDLHVALSLALVAGMTGLAPAEGNLQLHFANFAAYLLELRQLQVNTTTEIVDQAKMDVLRDAAKDGDWAQFMVDSLRFCKNRRFFVTEKGYFGIGSATILTGDTCCVLLGAPVPYILVKAKNGYVLIGESYIHGIMRGEVVGLCKSGKLHTENILIH